MYKIIDLFAGCGGLTEGFEKTKKYETIACIEWDKAAARTCTKRLREKWGYSDADDRVLVFDIQRTKELLAGWKNDAIYGSHEGLDKLVEKLGDIDIIIGGPPCQAYSVAGRVRDKHGMHYDYRNYLFESYLKIVDHYQPKLVVFENVPGILSASPGGISIIKRITESFDATGFELVEDIKKNALIDFSLFGVPQKRRRVIILAINRSFFENNPQKAIKEFYDEILPAFHCSKKSTVRDAISGLPHFYPSDINYKIKGKKYSHKPPNSNIPQHIPRYHNRRDIEIFKELSTDLDTGKNHYNSVEKLKRLYSEKTGKTSNIHKYYVLRWNEPSNTIPAHLYKDGLRHIHPDPEQARTITVREAARLQTFDDNFVFLGNMGDQYKMIGNAVPPIFSNYLALSIIEFIDQYK